MEPQLEVIHSESYLLCKSSIFYEVHYVMRVWLSSYAVKVMHGKSGQQLAIISLCTSSAITERGRVDVDARGKE